jgi:Flp pilus assembly protein TadG
MNRRGSTLVESTLVVTIFLLFLIAIADFGRLGFAYNSVTFATHRAARWASIRGASSGHAATIADVQADVQANLVALDNAGLTINVTWTPDKNPGSQVRVDTTYDFQPLLIPVSSGKIALKSSSQQIITQ